MTIGVCTCQRRSVIRRIWNDRATARHQLRQRVLKDNFGTERKRIQVSRGIPCCGNCMTFLALHQSSNSCCRQMLLVRTDSRGCGQAIVVERNGWSPRHFIARERRETSVAYVARFGRLRASVYIAMASSRRARNINNRSTSVRNTVAHLTRRQRIIGIAQCRWVRRLHVHHMRIGWVAGEAGFACRSTGIIRAVAQFALVRIPALCFHKLAVRLRVRRDEPRCVVRIRRMAREAGPRACSAQIVASMTCLALRRRPAIRLQILSV
jgi:hypothetical protein